MLITHNNVTMTADSGHVEAAVKAYKDALVLRSDFPEATCNLLHTLQVSKRQFSDRSYLKFWNCWPLL